MVRRGSGVRFPSPAQTARRAGIPEERRQEWVSFHRQRGVDIARARGGRAIIDAIQNALFERIDHTLNDPAEIRRIIEEALATVPAEDFPTITCDMGPEPTTSQFTRESEWTNRIPPVIGRTWERVRSTNATALLSASLTSGRRVRSGPSGLTRTGSSSWSPIQTGAQEPDQVNEAVWAGVSACGWMSRFA